MAGSEAVVGLAARIPKSLQRALKLHCVTVDTCLGRRAYRSRDVGPQRACRCSGTVTRAEVQALLV
jgi:hypothetical protein